MTTEQLAIVAPALVRQSHRLDNRPDASRDSPSIQRRLAQQARAHAAYAEMLRMVGWVMELITRGLENPLRTHKSPVDYVDRGHGPDTTNSVFGES